MQEEILRILGRVEIETIAKRLNSEKLSQAERNYLSRSIRPKLIAARILTEEKLLERIKRPDASIEKKITYNLSKYGYPLIALKKARQKTIPIENLIELILTKCPKPRFIEAIPILLLKNDISAFKLVEIAAKNNIKNQLGYLIETACIIADKFKIKSSLGGILDYFNKNMDIETKQLGDEKGKSYTEFLLKTSPERIRKWNLLGRFFDEDFISKAEAYL